ncbi:uncharacterized protein LOC124887070 [Capsicum annuum]|uniref:uncharacterized protein LOC124887070 n=1 Tax=Capsicum annuum TaxID=4072 RepID=UPI001FB0FAAE|nr:uncharacterized protein LOC124887070 [Capsicum annuum]
MVFGGYFRQVLPVIPKSTRAKTVNASLVKSYLWHRMERIKLTRNMRSRTDPSFSEFILRIGNGEEPTIRDDLVLLPKQLVIQNTSNSTGEDTLVKEIFPSMDKNASESRTFLSFDFAEDDTNNYYQEDYLNTLTPNGLPPHRGFDKNVIHAEIMIGQNAFKHVFIPGIQLSPPKNEGKVIRCTLKRNINANKKSFGHDRAAKAKKRNINQKHHLQRDIRFRRYTITLD